MRLRPIGPGIGGLNYSPLLKDGRSLDQAARAARHVTQRELSSRGNRSLGALWLSMAAAARRVGDQYCQARMEQARAYIAQRSSVLEFDSTAASQRGPRYY